MRLPLLALPLLLSAVAPSNPVAGPGETEARQLARAKSAAEGLRDALQGQLAAALASGGPAAAVEVCASVAPGLAKAHSRDGVVVGRTGTRLRNPGNAAPAWARPLLEALGEAPPEARGVRTTKLPGGRLGVVLPISTGKPCLQCHGTEVSEPVREVLGQRYPADAATGYREGELRGAFWVEVP
ncbi:MAG: hypothetical protein RL653_328 [Pseudomonadota bacterium]|jgi:hypothetical protein